VNREPTLDELIGADTTGAERQRLQHAHELLLQAGPPPELSDKLEGGPTLGMTLGQKRRVKRRAMLLVAATLTVVLVFLAGYAVANHGTSGPTPVITQALKGTAVVPQAQGTLEVWDSQSGNWPMRLTEVGLPTLGPHTYYEVYLVRDGKPWGLCGTFRVAGTPEEPVTVSLTAPYTLRKGDTWVVTRPGQSGNEPGQTVLRRSVTA
jgi:hypothetical protein